MNTDGSLRQRRKYREQDYAKPEQLQSQAKNRRQHNFLAQPVPLFQIFITLFLIRLFNALTIETFFQADEFYQSLEPAYDLVFKSGYITWEWSEGIRSSIHPLVYALGYKIASCLQLRDDIIIITPKVIGAFIASIGEVYLYKFAQSFTRNEKLAKLTLILSLLNPFNWYFITRSFSNGFEMVLTTMALAYWPWDGIIDYRSISISCMIAFISCIVRPTNVLIWLFLGLRFMFQNYATHKSVGQSVKLIIILCIELMLVLSANTVLDYSFYGEWTFPLYNFVEFNVIRNLSIFYGVAPWHFYIFQGLPIILMTYLPWFLHSFIFMKNYKLVLGQLIIIVVVGFSLISHKEIRFIYPLQPIFLTMVSISITHTYQPYKKYYKVIIPSVIILNAAISIFFSRVHERGVIDVIEYLRTDPNVESFGFLTPCHSTPWQSHIHNPELIKKSWFLTCEPPLHLTTTNIQDIKSYRDESDKFYDNPITFLHENFPSFTEQQGYQLNDLPSHLIIFEPLEKLMNDYFEHSNYHQCKRFFNSYFHWDDRRNGDVIVYCRP